MLKLHRKADKRTRSRLITALCGSREAVCRAVRSFATRPALGALGPRELVIGAPSAFHLGENAPYLMELGARLGIASPLEAMRFVGGTMFWGRAGVLLDAVRRTGLPRLLEGLNTPRTLDWRWYAKRYGHLRLETHAQAAQHWATHGAPGGLLNNAYCGRPDPHMCFRDGMLEHAYERALGWIYVDRGLHVEPMPET